MKSKRDKYIRYAVNLPIITNKGNVEYCKGTVSHIHLGLEKGLLTMPDIYNKYKKCSDAYLSLST